MPKNNVLMINCGRRQIWRLFFKKLFNQRVPRSKSGVVDQRGCSFEVFIHFVSYHSYTQFFFPVCVFRFFFLWLFHEQNPERVPLFLALFNINNWFYFIKYNIQRNKRHLLLFDVAEFKWNKILKSKLFGKTN